MKVIILRYGELFLKGNNRKYFEDVLKNNIKKALTGFDFEFKKITGRYEISNFDPTQIRSILDKLSRVFGIHSMSVAEKVETGEDAIYDVIRALDLSNKTFRVTTKRASKIFPIHSMEFNCILGGIILDNSMGSRVDLHNPQVEVRVDIRENGYTYISTDDIIGAEGMPYGTAGKGLLLLSGGIDSPVAGYFLAKRGLTIEAIHFHSYPYTSTLARDKVMKLAQKMCDYIGSMKIHIVSVTHIQEEIHKNCDPDYMITLLRRMMMRISQNIAKKIDAGALITGESLGQVASQTLQSIITTNAVVDMPIFRPLIGFDKIDIMDVARQIGTYDISILPYEDCCTVFLPKTPVTKPRLERVLREESKLNIDELLQQSLDSEEIVEV